MLIERGTIVGSYRIDGILGRGGMAVVYSARHLQLDRAVALKVLAEDLSDSPEFVERFRREGRLQASLEHPHTVTVYEAGESEYGLYLAMQLIPGPTLALLLEERALDARRALALLDQVADALDATHAAGLVHRDIKPQNILIGDADDAYLSDFGLGRGEVPASFTATGRLLGTVAYLAPEVIRGAPAGAASDRYAFAAMTFECLTGTPVFPRGTTAAMLYAHTAEPPPRISDRRRELPPSLDDVFSRGLAKEPRDRPSSAGEMISAVRGRLAEAGCDALGPPATELVQLDAATVDPGAPPPIPPKPRRRLLMPWLAIAALAGAVVGVAVGAFAIGHGSSRARSEPPPGLLAGAQVLGSSLDSPGSTLDCRGQPPAPDSPSCTIMQTQLPGSTLVVPEDGVIRRWEVRSARGELSLAVLRLGSSHSGGALQVARSQNEFVENCGVYTFPTDLAVERGDRIGIVLIGGSGIGVRHGVSGTTTERWVPRLQGAAPSRVFRAGTGFDDELLLRVEYVSGVQQRIPNQVTGAQASALPPGRVVRRSGILRLKDGRHVQVAVVAVAGRLVLDEFVDGHRTARSEVPAFRPPGRIITYQVNVDDTGEGLQIYIEYAREDSTRILDHFYAADATKFEFVN